ncbi:hypothetical protein L1987_20279 [Smallanthus sonchifolius]|uniref:Uncharacterized protein n=1 Tax=Smallanthus sonchifolius TaxID=185202 RepID=A0ACB9IUB4_9ASTR|nr:hypothetical protein L1987_20279 [Smallanthus sonchifolius]
MKDLTGIKMSTHSEMIKQVRKEQIVIQQSISLNTSKVPTTSPLDIMKIKKEIGEETKDSPSQLTPPIRRYVIKRDDNSIETFKCISNVLKLPDSDLQKITSLGIDRQLDGLSSSESSKGDEEEEEEEPLFGNENDPDSSDNDEKLVDSEVALAHLKVPISKCYRASYRCPQKLKKGAKLLEKIRQSVWTISGQEKVAPISTYIPTISWEYVDGNYELKKENGSVENYNSIELLCIDERSMLNLVELPMGNEEKANNIEQTIKAFAKAYQNVNK